MMIISIWNVDNKLTVKWSTQLNWLKNESSYVFVLTSEVVKKKNYNWGNRINNNTGWGGER